jgi:hypothetical protein
MTAYNSTREQAEATAQQFADYARELESATPQTLKRTWGFEIETPDADIIANQLSHAEGRVIDCKQDGSVTGGNQECDCDCRSCVYHDCDCDNCEDNNNGEPDHDCGNSECMGQYQELTSIGGLDTTHPEALDILTRYNLESCEINDSCGLHVHVWAGDLTPLQVARVLTLYRLSQDTMDTLAGRANVYYAQNNPTEHEDATRLGRNPDGRKYWAVNVNPYFNYLNNGTGVPTIEFRQHEGTNDTARVRAWGRVMVALVDYAKTDRPIYWVAKATDLRELLTALI